MSTQKKIVKKVTPKYPVKRVAGSKASKVPQFKLLTYTLKAVIPVGQYANIQPEITVQAETIQKAERAVMPYIEAMFAKYRGDGSQTLTAPVTVTGQAQARAQVTVPAQSTGQGAATPARTPDARATASGNNGSQSNDRAPAGSVSTPEAPIVLTAPFNRAKQAVESCTSAEALKLVSDQITKSTKLTQEEKNTLIMMVSDRSKTITK